jgi:uncharacterized protein YijF (DUF1287 family)
MMFGFRRIHRLLVLSLLFGVYPYNATFAYESLSARFVAAAVALEDSSVIYDSTYHNIPYPMGDVSADKGVCADVIVRAYRAIGIDLQQRVHLDMKKNFSAYPKLWGLNKPDSNIDHRRVPNLRVFFKLHGTELEVSNNPKNYKPGSIVSWNLRDRGSLPHIGIVTNLYSPDKQRPLIMHNIGGGQVLEDILFKYTITGHYRYGID